MAGRWISEAQFSAYSGLARQTLANWRYRDRQAGRTEPLPGFPEWRTFGRAIRYWLPAESRTGAAT
jgi:hypothetical protein